MNKKGSFVFLLFIFVIFIFLAVIFLGVSVWGFSLVNDTLDLDAEIGNVNLQAVNNQSFGMIANSFQSGADYLGLALIFGMVLGMFAAGYFAGPIHKIWFIADIGILFATFILSVYVAQAYSDFIGASSLLNSIYVNNLPKTSAFMLNLPLYVSSIGIIMMILTYLSKSLGFKQNENVVAGY